MAHYQKKEIEFEADQLSKHTVYELANEFIVLRKSYPDDIDLRNRYESFKGEMKVAYKIKCLMADPEFSPKLTVPHYQFWSEQVRRCRGRLINS